MRERVIENEREMGRYKNTIMLSEAETNRWATSTEAEEHVEA